LKVIARIFGVERRLDLVDQPVGRTLIGFLGQGQADRDRAGAAEGLQRGLADAELVDILADGIEARRGLELRFDHHAADEIDAQVEPAKADQRQSGDGQQSGQPERPVTQADETDVGVVGDELEEAHIRYPSPQRKLGSREDERAVPRLRSQPSLG
jgi:hypothetical protein